MAGLSRPDRPRIPPPWASDRTGRGRSTPVLFFFRGTPSPSFFGRVLPNPVPPSRLFMPSMPWYVRKCILSFTSLLCHHFSFVHGSPFFMLLLSLVFRILRPVPDKSSALLLWVPGSLLGRFRGFTGSPPGAFLGRCVGRFWGLGYSVPGTEAMNMAHQI